MKASELCPPPHLEAADLEGDTVLTIKGVDFREVGDEKVTKGVVFFDEHKRGLVLNRTNLKRIIAAHGNETDSWVGKKITLYPSETDYQGKTVDCIRVREKK
jgi:hypothetical protein